MNFRESPYIVDIFDFDLLHLQLNTPLFIFALVLLVMFFLQKWLFGPVLATLDARRAKTDEWHKQTCEQQQQMAQIVKTCEQRLTQIRKESLVARQTQTKEIEKETEQMLQKARQQAQAQLDRTVAAMGEEAEQARQNLAHTVQTLAERLRARLLGA